MCILLVEDGALIRKLLVEDPPEHGYEVCEAENGDHAFILIKDLAKPVMLLINDIHMAGQRNGLDIARLVQGYNPEVPIIYTTGRPDAIADLDPLRPHDALVRKPSGTRELMKLVKQLSPPAE